MNNIFKQRAQWDSNFDYLIVTIGSVIGLGNIFQFPFFVAKFGPMFILVYLLCELLISLPIIISEFFIGRRGKQNPVGAISLLALESGANYRWRWIGWICFTILVLSLGYYCLNVSVYLSSLMGLTRVKFHMAEFLTSYSPSTSLSVISFLSFLALAMLVVARGVNRGLEKISRIVVPAFFMIFLMLAIYACAVGNFKNALLYLVAFTQPITPQLLLTALTFAFFKLNTAMGTMIVYGSYLPATTRIGKSTLIIAGFDLLGSLLSYFIIFPLLLSHENPTQLAQHTVESFLNTIMQVPGGAWFAAFFLLATIFAAWMPAIAFGESAVVTLIERGYLKRINATVIITLLALLVGLLIIFATPLLPEGWSFGEMVQELASQILMPISAFLLAIFVGWKLKKEVAQTELDFSPMLFHIWRFLVRYIAPIFIVIVFVYLFWI